MVIDPPPPKKKRRKKREEEVMQAQIMSKIFYSEKYIVEGNAVGACGGG